MEEVNQEARAEGNNPGVIDPIAPPVRPIDPVEVPIDLPSEPPRRITLKEHNAPDQLYETRPAIRPPTPQV